MAHNRYPAGSYGVFALKNLEPGTLLVVEQPFASIDNRISGERRCHSLNYWQSQGKESSTEFCNDDRLHLLNEVEKQLAIGKTSWITFDRLKLMQPIRQWLAETKGTGKNEQNENHGESDGHQGDRLENDDDRHVLFEKQWQKLSSK